MLMRLPTWLRAAIITAAQVLAAAVLAVVLDVLRLLTVWAFGGDPPALDDLRAAALAIVGAILVFLTAVVTAIYRRIRPLAASYPDAIDATATEITDASGHPLPAGAVPTVLLFRGQPYTIHDG